jgi:hypothetical protein
VSQYISECDDEIAFWNAYSRACETLNQIIEIGD